MRKPEYTLLEFTSEKGNVYAVVKTTDKHYALYGLKPLDSCISYLRSHHAKKFIIDDGRSETIHDMPQSKMETPKTTWFKEFAEKLLSMTTANKNTRFKIETKYEVDHCSITDTLTIDASLTSEGNLLINTYKHSGWSGSNTVNTIVYSKKTSYNSATDKETINLLYENSDKIYEQLNPEG